MTEVLSLNTLVFLIESEPSRDPDIGNLNGYDPELDAAIGLAVGLPTVDRTGEPGWHGRYFIGPVPAYTMRDEDARTLLPEDWLKIEQVETPEGASCTITLADNGISRSFTGRAKTISRAFLGAAVRAKLIMQGQ